MEPIDVTDPLVWLGAIPEALLIIGASLLLAAAFKVAFNWAMRVFFD